MPTASTGSGKGTTTATSTNRRTSATPIICTFDVHSPAKHLNETKIYSPLRVTRMLEVNKTPSTIILNVDVIDGAELRLKAIGDIVLRSNGVRYVTDPNRSVSARYPPIAEVADNDCFRVA